MTAVAFHELHPRFTAMRDYLAGLARGRLPARTDLDPIAFRADLPYVNLLDVVPAEAGPRFRFRLVGTAQTQSAGLEYTGRYVDEIVSDELKPRVIADLTKVVTTRQPLYGRYPMPFPGRDFIMSERVFFPLASDGETVDAILVLHNYPALVADDTWRLEQWRSAAG